MRPWLKRLLILAVLALVVSVAARFLMRRDPVPVTVYRVARGTVEDTVTNSKAGTVTAHRRAKMSPEVGGRVAFIGFREGARVRRGDVLLRISDRDLRAALALALRDVESARAAAREPCVVAGQARRELDRNRDLVREGIVSDEIVERLESEVAAAESRCEAARAAAERAESAVDLARANLDKTVLRAPFDGIVADVDAEVGEWVAPSPPAVPIPPVFDILDPTSIYVSAPLDEVDAGRVARGLPARLTLDPYPGRGFSGRVTRVAPYVQDQEEQNRTLDVDVAFDDQEFARTLYPGTSADVEIILQARDDVLRVPAYALLEGDRVLVYEDGRLVERTLSIGVRNWEFAEVLEGLAEGDPVVVSLDREEVKAGAAAEITEEAPARASPSPGGPPTPAPGASPAGGGAGP